MHHRYDRINLPIEVIRTIVTIAETGSFLKAAEWLKLSQPAISSQVKRLQHLVGGPLFERSAGGMILTPLGQMLHAHARRLLDANDQILMLAGNIGGSQPVRVGIATTLVRPFLTILAECPVDRPISIHCAPSMEIGKALSDGFLDVACLLNAPATFGSPAAEWQESLCWVKSPGFVVSPGSPIPIICSPGSWSDQTLIQAFEKNNLAYRVTFSSADHHARMVAAASGMGLLALPERDVAKPLIVAKDYYLPPLAPLTAAAYVRSDLPAPKVDVAVRLLQRLASAQNRHHAA